MKDNKTLILMILSSLCVSVAWASLSVNVDIQYYDEIYEDGNHRLYSGTGAAPDTGTYWNQAASMYGRTVTNLLRSDGVTPTSIGLTWTSNGEYGHPSPPAPNRLLMDYGFANLNYQAILVTGLAPGSSYDLYLYGNETYASGGQVYSRGTTFSFNGQTKATTGWGGGDAFVEGGTYVVFAGVIADQNGEISGTYGDGANYNSFNGMQIVIPEPATVGLLSIGSIALIRRKRQ